MSSSLAVVEALLQEFHQPATPNIRKREIETELIAFRGQASAWQISLQVAASIETNQYLWFFSTSTLEHWISRRWTHLTANERTLLRETLWNTYANLSVVSVQRRQRDTFAQLIALIGKREFPDDHPSYIIHCLELIRSDKFILGVTLLRITSEEVLNNRDCVTTERQNYFNSCISMCIPEILDLLTKYLIITVYHINDKDIHSLPNNLVDYALTTSLPNDNQLSSAVLELLTCVQHLVSWTRTELISEYFLMSILDLAQWRATQPDISLAALSVLNELLYLQKPLPHALTIMSGVNGLLEQHNTTKHQSEMYADKFRELLRLYTDRYWSKMVQQNELLESFLKSLYCCTISKNGALDFMEKLEIWTPIIKGLMLSSKQNRYNDVLYQLVVEIMRRILFEFNKSELELLDNELIEENTQTEWQQFLSQCIECIALVGESRPNAVFAQVSAHWSRPHVYLLSLESDLDSGKLYELGRKLKSQSFNEHLRDLSTVCQAVVRLSPLLDINSPEVGAEVTSQLKLLTENLLTLLKFFTSNKIATLNLDKSTFQTDFDYLYAQIIMAIHSILPMSINLKYDEVIQSLFDALGAILLPNNVTVAPIVSISASQLLLCISTVIRPKRLLETMFVMQLMQAGLKLTHLPRQAITNIYISLIGYLVLPWKIMEEQQQDYTSRCNHVCEYVKCQAQNFLELDSQASVSKISSVMPNSLGIFSEVIEYFKDSCNTTKDMLALAFRPIITKALMLFNDFGISNNAISISTADLSLSILRSLLNQFGAQFIKDMITLYITVSSREQLSLNQLTVLEKILHMFQLVVQQPGNTWTTMLPSILNFTIEQVLPLLQQHDSSLVDGTDLSSTVYALFDSILLHKWQYFYKPHVQYNGSLLHTSSDNLHPEHFMAILNAYGQVLVSGNDPNLVRKVLLSMQTVNERWRLFQRALFQDSLLTSFQRALINRLLSGEGSLHFDQLANVLYAMGQVDNLKLRESFVTAGFPVNPKYLDVICLSTDIPTFSQKLSQLIQDAHSIHLTQT
ncbi:PREDICTED: exportin-6 [Bactrocera latifrons]|uniref:Exportin-6 n=1 Tax=Bactrocera latifrons TaxID=174628 RepID=A0A0K8WJ94_BACLA|nr:PREDICTED: exportin-6 [Bactrocera latifrons]